VFTGLVAQKGRITEVEQETGGVRLVVAAGGVASELAEGDSVAVNGVCLTATHIEGGAFSADVMAETLRLSSLGPAEQGDEVNLELALRATDRLGGHVVQGHVDGVGTVEGVSDEGFARVVRVAAASHVLRYVVAKGSIAVDGVSLTVVAVDEQSFSVSLIPETLERTTLGSLAPGRTVNLEVDVLAKYVEKLVANVGGAAS